MSGRPQPARSANGPYLARKLPFGATAGIAVTLFFSVLHELQGLLERSHFASDTRITGRALIIFQFLPEFGFYRGAFGAGGEIGDLVGIRQAIVKLLTRPSAL